MMLRRDSIPFRLAALILVAGLATTSLAKIEEIPDASKLPQAVQKTVKEQVADGKIVRIRKETVDGKVAYGVECAKDQRKWQIEVAPNGGLLLRAEEMALTNLTAAAQKTVQEKAASGRIESITSVSESGQSYYEAAVTFSGQEKTFIVGADGKLIDTQIPENQIRLPGADDVLPRNGEPKGGGYSQQY